LDFYSFSALIHSYESGNLAEGCKHFEYTMCILCTVYANALLLSLEY